MVKTAHLCPFAGDEEIPGPPDGTIDGDFIPPEQSLGFACVLALPSGLLGPEAYLGNRKLASGNVVPHGAVVRFHCPIPRYYRLDGAAATQCVDGDFNQTSPTCEPGIIARRLVVDVEAEYVIGPGGLYVVPPGVPVKMDCYKTLTTGGKAPEWQWEANREVFVKEDSFLGSKSSSLRLDTVEGTKGVFVCSNQQEEVIVRLEARGDRCLGIPRCPGLRVRSNTLKADFACQPPGILQGPLSARCQHFRDWDVPAPKCLYKTCSPQDRSTPPRFPCTLPEISGALVAFAGNAGRVRSGDVIESGQWVQFHCHPVGIYLLAGQNKLTCDDGKWDHDVPICALSTTNTVLVMLDFAHSIGPGGVVHVLPYTDVIMRCVSTDKKAPPSWTHEVIDTKVVERKTSERHTSTTRLIFRTTENTTGTFTCHSKGARRSPETKQIRLVTTAPVCPEIAESGGLRVRANFEMAVFACDPPGVLIGSPVLRCQVFGQWNHPVPYCFYRECEHGNASQPTTPTPSTSSSPDDEQLTTAKPPVPTLPAVSSTRRPATTSPPKKAVPDSSTASPPPSDQSSLPTCPEESGIFPHPSDCSKFVHCSFGKPNVIQCPGETVFNPVHKVCDSRTAVTCP
ncbi:uncharacterized protein LOC135367547 [Ornithodoros turicata]|uniref:uncharacterized protein LOC135367547 n=1 Tax=Ornithodoros turicata TaxID=34597 RepID=UPI00313896B1